ncbi:MAG: lasso RiPP family leader peptide-containing protein [bacterium]|nr:lasso RiPP family leader peptide-containing protein [bacterium]
MSPARPRLKVSHPRGTGPAGLEDGRGALAVARLARSEKRRYKSPRLERHGDLRTLTLGGSPGVGDSGDMFSQNPLV